MDIALRKFFVVVIIDDNNNNLTLPDILAFKHFVK